MTQQDVWSLRSDQNVAEEGAEQTRLLGARFSAFLRLGDVTDVVVNGCAEVWIDSGCGLRPVLSPFASDTELKAEAIRLAAIARRRLDDSCPIADGVVAGVRFHAVLPPLSVAPLISLRIVRRQGLDLDTLAATGSLSPRLHRIALALVDKRWNVLISGATGAGKTTVLAALLGCVAKTQRILCIEEVPELSPAHPHVVALRERGANVQGKGAVTMTELVRAAMRMRPDRIVLGECRGPEIVDVLTAMNTGHSGCWATIHANSVSDVPARVCALGALAGISVNAVNAQANAAINAVIHVSRSAGKRWVSGFGVPCLPHAVGDATDDAAGDIAGDAAGTVGAASPWLIEPVVTVSKNGEETVSARWPVVATRLGIKS